MRKTARPPNWRGGWYGKVLDYCCGDLTDEALFAAAGTSRFSQCEAHFNIGLRRLADGDRARAKKSLRASVDTGVYFYREYDWGSAFLARMEADPTWPKWIPQLDPANRDAKAETGQQN